MAVIIATCVVLNQVRLYINNYTAGQTIALFKEKAEARNSQQQQTEIYESKEIQKHFFVGDKELEQLNNNLSIKLGSSAL